MKKLLLLFGIFFASIVGVGLDSTIENEAIIPGELEMVECMNCDEID
tara:strand:+ start:1690 stop:1830 length:141 start_codon:yes stop_codon:yes gene_type:complete